MPIELFFPNEVHSTNIKTGDKVKVQLTGDLIANGKTIFVAGTQGIANIREVTQSRILVDYGYFKTNKDEKVMFKLNQKIDDEKAPFFLMNLVKWFVGVLFLKIDKDGSVYIPAGTIVNGQITEDVKVTAED